MIDQVANFTKIEIFIFQNAAIFVENKILPLEVPMLEREAVGGTFEVGIGVAGFESEAAGTNTDSSSFRPNV